MPVIPLAAAAAAKAAPAVAAAAPSFGAQLMSAFGSSAVAGLASGLTGGIANRVQHTIQRGRPNYGQRSAQVQTHQEAYGKSGAYETEAKLKKLDFDYAMALKRYEDTVSDRRQEEANQHQLVMAAMGGSKGMAQAFKEAVTGADLDRLIHKYNYLNRAIKEEPSSDGWPPPPKIDSSRKGPAVRKEKKAKPFSDRYRQPSRDMGNMNNRRY